MEWDKFWQIFWENQVTWEKPSEETVLNNTLNIEVKVKRGSSNEVEMVKGGLECNTENGLKQRIQNQDYITVCNLE